MNRRTIFYWLIGIVIAAIVIAAAFQFDQPVRHFIAQHRSQSVYHFMQGVSRFGDWSEHFALGLILAGIAWWRGSKEWTRVFLSMLVALALAGVVGRGIKIGTARPRPSVKTERTLDWSRFSSKYHAFPSGHVAASTAFFGVLFLASRRVGLACLPIPILIGFSRLYVEAHYLSDVVFAAILGVLCALFTARLLRLQIENRKLSWRRG